jgi:hypothetical protein
MLRDMARSRLIQSWFAVVALGVVASAALGAAVTVRGGALLLALSVIPPLITLMLWPDPQPATASEVLYGTDRRG